METFYSVLHFKGMQIGWNIVGDFPQNWIRAGLATPKKVSDLFVFYLLTCPVNMDYQGTSKYFFRYCFFWPIVDSIRVRKTASLAEFLLGKRFLMKRLPIRARMLHVPECNEGSSRLISVDKDLFFIYFHLAFFFEIKPATCWFFAQFFKPLEEICLLNFIF